jgi:membrane dipeptidase
MVEHTAVKSECFSQLGALCVVAVLSACAATKPVPPGAEDIHRRAVVVDAHDDITEAIVYGGYDFAARHDSSTDTDLPRMRDGGLDAEIFAIWINPNRVPRERWSAEAEHELVVARERLAAAGLGIARTARDVRENAAHGVTSALFGLEGGYMLGDGTPDEMLARLRRFAELGIRYLTLTHSMRSPLGGSSGDDSDVEGLTDFGRHAIDEMQRLGIVVDLSHVSDPLFWDAIRVAKKPVIASHSSARALANVPRNMTDAMLKAVAKNGGAVCVNFFPGFLDQRAFDDLKRAQAELEREGLKPDRMAITEQRRVLASKQIRSVDAGVVADHIEHVVKIAGIDHVCLGSDYDGIPTTPRGLDDVSKFPALTTELLRRGMSEADVEKVLGSNLLRVLEANER